jgi:hypothetical protein
MAAFSITSAQPGAHLPLTRRGRVDFTVTNTSHRELTARAHVVTEGSAQTEWFTIVGPQRDSPPDATHQFGVQVAVPIEAPSGSYRFRLDVVAVEDPDEYEGEGVWATLQVPPAPEPRRIPLWAVIAAAVLLVAILVGVYFKFIRQPPRANLEANVTQGQQGFGSIPVGQGSPGSVVTVKNSGGADATVVAKMQGANPKDFQILANTCDQGPLKPGATCQLQVGFQPTGQGNRTATLVVSASNAPTPAVLTWTGLGQGTAAAVTFTPPAVSLVVPPAVIPGYSTLNVAQVVTIKNNGGTPFTISTVKLLDLAQAFQLVSGCEGRQLNGGDTCDVVVILATRNPGVYNATLVVADNAPGAPQSVPIAGVRR